MVNLLSSNKPAKKTRLAVEQLEDRLVPAITFASFSTGTYAYNTDINQWRQITAVQFQQMDEGADGTMFASYNYGTWRYDYFSNSWSRLTSGQASELSAANDNTLFASYSNGTWEYDTTGWHLMTTNIATQLAAVRDNSFYGEFSDGLSKYRDGVWTYLTSARSVGNMGASEDGTLFVGYSSAIWRYKEYASPTPGYSPGYWTMMTSLGSPSNSVKDIVVVDSRTFYFSSASLGAWKVIDGKWTAQMCDVSATPRSMSADANSFVAILPDTAVWECYQGSWSRISTTTGANLVA